MDIIIAMGLPSSGKSTLLLSEFHKRNPHEIKYINTDDKDIYTFIHPQLENAKHRKCKTILIDGLFLENKEVANMINIITDIINEKINLYIYHFEDNRMLCLNNDLGRHKKSSKDIILTAKYENANKQDIIKNLSEKSTKLLKNIIIKELNIYKKKKYEIFAEYNNCDKILISDRWQIKGKIYTSYNEFYIVEEEQPCYFKEFYEILNKSCYYILDEEKKEIFNELVEIKYETETDDYGSLITYGYYTCTIEKLYSKLKEKNLLRKDYENEC